MADRAEVIKNIRKDGNSVFHSTTYSVNSEKWGIDIHFRTPTIAQQDKYLPNLGQGRLEGYADMIIALALESEVSHRPLFADSDKNTFLNNADPAEVIRIGEEILKIILRNKSDQDDALKNLEPTED